jgi:hypothetical protein
MDFRYTVHDRWHGEFHLDHCGALLDVEPMGPDYVAGMCHTIEDPTFDATAVATNPRAQVRPLHRPPRQPAERHPHCAWTVVIDPSHPEAQPIPALAVIAQTRAAQLLAGYRGAPPCDAEALAQAMVNLGRLACELGDVIEAVDVNPVAVRAQGRGVVALDALVVLRPPH